MKWVCKDNRIVLDELAEKMPEASKGTLREILKEGRFLVKEQVVKSNISLQKGDVCEIKAKKKYTSDIEILYEDKEIIVVEKPEGLLSVATSREIEHTLHNKLKRRFSRVWPVHRLDRETSGLLVFALTEEARSGLIEQFSKHTIEREYRAIVVGKIPQNGIWKHHLVEDGNLKMHVTHQNGMYAETHFTRLEIKGGNSFVQFKLKTGKKNQIRVQSSAMGFPILGDKKYGTMELDADRMYLHAHKLGFFHPISKKKMVFYSPIPFSIR